MKRFVWCLSCFLILSINFLYAQADYSKGYVIQGYIEGIINQEKIFLYDIDRQVYIDSAIVSEGVFVMKGKVPQPTTCWMRYKNEYAIIQVENTDMEYRSPVKDMRLHAIMKGGKEQDLQNQLTVLQYPYEVIYYNAYDSLERKQYVDKKDQQRLTNKFNAYQDSAQSIYVEFGKRHPDSFLGLDVIYRNRQKIGKKAVEALFVKMGESLQSTTKGQALNIFIYGDLAKKGVSYIDFEAETMSGSPFKLSSLNGNYILLNFWNASCVPCRRENKKISKDYNRLKNVLAIVSFSTDQNKSSWIKASKEDNILWINVSDLKGVNGKIKTLYDVQAIPTSFLINKEGVIIEKFIGIDDNFLDEVINLVKNK